MITNNAYKCYAAGAFYKAGTFNRYDGTEMTCARGSGGNASIFAFDYMNSQSNSQYSYGIQLGDGIVEPMPTDYKLSGTMLTGLAVTVKYIKTEDLTGITHTAVLTITNNNTTDITISEVGLFEPGTYPSGNSTATTPMLIDHTLLDAPLTIPAEEVGQLTYSIRINFPELPVT